MLRRTYQTSFVAATPTSFSDDLLGKRITTHRWDAWDPFYHCHSKPVVLTRRTHPAPTGSRTLLSLPAEIRNQIFLALFSNVLPLDWSNGSERPLNQAGQRPPPKQMMAGTGATPASIIFTCRQFYVETRDLALRGCTIAEEDLPTEYRIIPEGHEVPCDYVQDR